MTIKCIVAPPDEKDFCEDWQSRNNHRKFYLSRTRSGCLRGNGGNSVGYEFESQHCECGIQLGLLLQSRTGASKLPGSLRINFRLAVALMR